MNSTHLGERRFEQRPRCLDAEIAAVPSVALSRALWATALIVAGAGILALVVLR
ncbi:MAG TPA: hypothetical protein VFD43_08425 [Planctomycetota bacterium]|nr:hypothetical protein [Planctomycetota bacterium]